MSARLTAGALAALLATAGVQHLRRPWLFDPLVPRWLPGRARGWTALSGGAELGVAVLLLVPPTRRLGGLAAEALFWSVWPGNVQMAWDWRHRRPWPRAVALARVPLQVPLIVAARRVRSGPAR